MATTLNAGVLTEHLRFLPALMPDATVLTAIAGNSGAVQAFSYPSLRAKRLVTLRALQHATTTGINLVATGDARRSKPIGSAADALWTPFNPMADHQWSVSAWNNLLVTAQNTTAATIDNYWMVPSLLVQAADVATKIKWGQPLTATDQALAKDAGLTGSHPRGVLPRTFEWMRQNEYQNQVLNAVPYAQTIALAAGGSPQTFAEASAQSHEVLVLAGLAVSPGSGTDGLTVIVSIDDGDLSLQWGAYALGQAHPTPWFLQATRNITVQMTSTDAVAAVHVAALIWHVRLTDEIRVRLGQITSGPVFDKITSGVL